MAMSIAKIPLEVQVETVEWPGANQGRVFLIFSAIFVSPAKTVFTLGAMITKLRFMLFILLNGEAVAKPSQLPLYIRTRARE